MTVDDIKKHLAYREQDRILFKSFTPSIRIKTQKNYTVFEEDEEKRLWCFRKLDSNKPTLFHYEDVVSYEFIENGKTVTSGGLSGAVIGEQLGGSTGAIVGATVGKNTSYEIKEMYIHVTLNHPYLSFEKIYVYSDKESYSTCRDHANQILARLKLMCEKVRKENESSSVQTSAADEIKKYKELLDMGAISQEEYDAKKKQLLNL